MFVPLQLEPAFVQYLTFLTQKEGEKCEATTVLNVHSSMEQPPLTGVLNT